MENSKNKSETVQNMPMVSVELPDAIVQKSPVFNNRLALISDIAKKSKTDNDEFEKLLSDPDSELDEEALAENQTKLKEAISYVGEAMESRKAITSIYNKKRDDMLKFYDKTLEDSGYLDLVKESERSKKFRKEAISHRINQRWSELKTTFDANLALYPEIQANTPNLAKFTTFRINHPKLVNGQKAFKLTDKVRGTINNEMASYNQTISDIKANPYNLSEHNIIEMLRLFENRPELEYVNGWAITFQQQERQAEQRKIEQAKLLEKQAEEAKIQAQKALEAEALAKQQKPEETKTQPTPAPAQKDVANVSVSTPITTSIQESTDPYSWLADFALTERRFSQFKTSDLQKIALVENLIAQMADKTSPVQQNINNPAQMIAVLKYVLN